eukprot:c4077_g1_i1.p1 GENE.c4077_g1_i1~~c4077_g1_i1.p1  ORF type:complete len:369 (-),score=83.33 c4077_g1_i1:23-1129(-)
MGSQRTFCEMSCLLFALLAAGSSQGPLVPHSSPEFEKWAVEFGKTYNSEASRAHAFENFVSNAAIIEKLNAESTDTAEYGHTRFSDLSPSEFRSKYFPTKVMAPENGRAPEQVELVNTTSVPSSFDWRDYNATTPVKDQSECGSCWAESAVENVESVVFLKNRGSATSPLALSVEQVVECDPHDYACYGGYPSNALKYIIEQGGLAADADYPFDVDGHVICLANQTFNETCGDGICDDPPLTGYCDLTCSVNQHKLVAQISSYKSLPQDEDQLAAFVAENNPISVALDASGLVGWLQFYKKGVANPKFCSTTRLDHAVLIVGFGEDSGTPYWTVRNSWGPKWGEEGYFRIVRGEGRCGINTMAVTAIA